MVNTAFDASKATTTRQTGARHRPWECVVGYVGAWELRLRVAEHRERRVPGPSARHRTTASYPTCSRTKTCGPQRPQGRHVVVLTTIVKIPPTASMNSSIGMAGERLGLERPPAPEGESDSRSQPPIIVGGLEDGGRSRRARAGPTGTPHGTAH